MESVARLIHHSHLTYLPTNFPALFYGLPDGKVYIVYARPYKTSSDKSELEFIFAEHEEFSFDYANSQLIPPGLSNSRFPVYNEMVDKPDPKFRVIKIDRNIHTYDDAIVCMNEDAKAMLEKPNKTKTIRFIPNIIPQIKVASV